MRDEPPAIDTRTDVPLGPVEAEPAEVVRLGRFAGLTKIGRGGMGTVYAGVDEQLGRRVAIKVLAQGGSRPETHARLLREAQALALLSHPNVVAIHEVGESEGRVYLVMEHIEGATLRAWLAAKQRSLAQILDVLRQAAAGLAAAHAAGLVHRDFKPDNVMVGADGRVRVMDFGLARAERSVDSVDLSLSSSRRWVDVIVTRGGAVPGTPAYMAPEHHHHGATSPRSDLFAFCVTAFEALHGQHPFPERDPKRLREAILRGTITRPARSSVPAWIDRALARGLHPDPDQRWANLQELVAALARDPRARARWWWRSALSVTLLAAVATPLVAWRLAARRAAAHAERERAATIRLTAAEIAIEGAASTAAADALFHAYVDDPAHHGTSALVAAWQHRGDRRRRAGDEGALDDYARAYFAARTAGEESAALRGMGSIFHARGDGDALARTLAARARRGDQGPESVELRLDAALFQRDLGGALAALSDLPADDPRRTWTAGLRQLATGIPTALDASYVSVLSDQAIAVQDPRGDITILDRRLRPIDRRRYAGALRLVPDTPWLLTFHDHELIAYDLLAPEESSLRWRGPSSQAPFRVFPVRRRGELDLLFARMSPTRGFRTLRGLEGPSPRELVAHASTEAADSDLEAAVFDDLDGDGEPELVAALGPWRALDLRVFRFDDAGGLVLRARRRIGRVSALSVVQHNDERLLLAVKDDHVADPDLFPDPPHTGSPAGVYLFRWDGAALSSVEFSAFPPSLLAGVEIHGRALDADLDGDGDDEFLLRAAHPTGNRAALIQNTDGAPLITAINRMNVLGAAQLDDDPASEVFVTLPPERQLWVLGGGDTPVPARASSLDPPEEIPPQLRDPRHAEHWSRSQDLAALGLYTSAAASLERAGAASEDLEFRRVALAEAAALWVRSGAQEVAPDLASALADDPAHGLEALAQKATLLMSRGRYEEAREAALALASDPRRSTTQAAAAAALLADLQPLTGRGRSLELRFDRPPAPAVSILRPAGLQHDPLGGVLGIAAIAGAPLLEVPLAWDGGPLAIEYALDLDVLEYGACVELHLLDAADRRRAGAGICSTGGGGYLYQGSTCHHERGDNESLTRRVDSGSTPRSLRISFVYLPGRSALECSFTEGGEPKLLRRKLGDPLPPGRYRLSLALNTNGDTPSLVRGALRSITLRGAQLAPPPLDPRAARPLALDELLAADALGDHHALAAAARAVLPHLNDPTWRIDLITILRTRPAAFAALRGAAGPAILPLLAHTWSVLGPHRRDPAIRREALQSLQIIDALTPTCDDERHALRALLIARADVWERERLPERARRDLTHALALTPTRAAEDPSLRLQAALKLVALLIGTEPEAALQFAALALAQSPAREEARQQLADIPGVAARAHIPAWKALLTASDMPPFEDPPPSR